LSVPAALGDEQGIVGPGAARVPGLDGVTDADVGVVEVRRRAAAHGGNGGVVHFHQRGALEVDDRAIVGGDGVADVRPSVT
jgi:hypothetical protein